MLIKGLFEKLMPWYIIRRLTFKYVILKVLSEGIFYIDKLL